MLTTQQERTIANLLTKKNLREAARSSEIAEYTLYKWLRQPEFKKVYEHAQTMLRETISSAIRSCAEDAVEVLKIAMLNEDETTRNRIVAAKAVLDVLYKDYDRRYLEKIKALEERRLVGSDNLLDSLPDEAVGNILEIISMHKKDVD